MAQCIECCEEKELTIHGTCWKCHLGSISFNTRIEARKAPSAGPTSSPTPSRVKNYETIQLT